jgi:hypothetical protein
MTRTLAATAVAPLAVIPVLTIIFGPWALTHGGPQSLAGILGPALIVAYPTMILFGLPMHMALVRQRCTRWRHYALVGTLLGAVPVTGYCIVAILFEAKFVVSALPSATVRNFEWGAIGVVVFGACSTAVAIAFRAISVKAFPS